MTENLQQFIDGLPGFKLTDSHFRIGSKIHISTFYYAKRFFQHSFFASRLAFIITRHLLKDNLKFLKEDSKRITFENEGLTLVGYGLYSELLLSLIEKFLKTALGIKKVNHNLINDAEEMRWIKKHETQYPNYLIIIPIASTLSTSFKIEEMINKLPGNKKVLPPPINVLLISNGSMISSQTNEIERKFAWKEKDLVKKRIYVSPLEAKKQTIIDTTQETPYQKYFLTMPSNWFEVQRCKICFPTNPIEEKPIFVTDKTSVTPLLIFDHPKGKIESEHNPSNKFRLTSDSLHYGHFNRENNHYLYYIKIEDFFEDNRNEIAAWLQSIASNREFKRNYSETDHVIMLAPGHYSNASFVNLVNEILFSNSANIIHYDPKTDHIQNFQTFYRNEIGGQVKKRIFYVDDTITTGTTFIRSNYFLKHTRPEEAGVDGCIVMIDRSSRYVHRNITRKLKNKLLYFSFADMNLGSLKDVEYDCSLCIERKRYLQLSEDSFLDRLKFHFLSQANKLLLDDHDIKLPLQTLTTSGEQHVFKVEVVHRIYEWFGIFSLADFKNISYDDWKKSWFNHTHSPFDQPKFKSNKIDFPNISEETGVIFKVLTQSPFTHYKPIKRKIFTWVLSFLDRKQQQITDGLGMKKPVFSYQQFKDLKFLIRRAGLLGANYLISTDFLDAIHLMLLKSSQKIVIKDIIEIERRLQEQQYQSTLFHIESFDRDKKIKNLNSFNVFFSAQVKELLFMNEARSIRLEMNLIKMEEKLIGQESRSFCQLLRILREENGILISKFWDFIRNEALWVIPDHDISRQLTAIADILRDPDLKQHYRFETLKEFFAVTGNEIEGNTDFHHYLSIMSYLSKEKSTEISLSEKTRFLIDRLKCIIGVENEQVGSAFIVKYDRNKQDVFFAHSESSHNTIGENNWSTPSEDYLQKFLDGINDNTSESKLTVIEFEREGDNTWRDLYSTEDNALHTDLPFSSIPKAFNRIILLRINKRKSGKEPNAKVILDEPQGVIVLYFTSPANGGVTPVDKVRYLLLLRNPISEFIREHHENSDFRDWVENDKQRRLANLTGHGRETLLDLVHDYPESKNIILNMEHLQTIILLKNNMKSIRGDDATEVFQKFYSVQNILEADSTYFHNLEAMVKTLFSNLDHVENRVSVKFLPQVDSDIKFPFSKSILDMILFELIINAKKNRWHFIEEDNIYGTTGDEKLDMKYDENYVWIVAHTEKDLPGTPGEEKLIVEIFNTGPTIDKQTYVNLNTKNPIKGKDTLSGITLIEELLREFKLGKISYTSHVLNQDVGFSRFGVKLILNKM